MRLKRPILWFGLLATFSFWLGQYWLFAPKDTLEKFIGHTSRQEYSEASAMLLAPSKLEPLPNGGLRAVDRSGSATELPVGHAPFLASSGSAASSRTFSDWVGRRLEAEVSSLPAAAGAPARTLALSVHGSQVQIDSIR
jgi:hypothetical protein